MVGSKVERGIQGCKERKKDCGNNVRMKGRNKTRMSERKGGSGKNLQGEMKGGRKI